MICIIQFTAVLEEPLQTQLPVISTSNGQLVLAVINSDGLQTSDTIVNQLGPGGNLSNLSPSFSNAIMGMLQQCMSQQQQGGASASVVNAPTNNLLQLPSAPTQGMTM